MTSDFADGGRCAGISIEEMRPEDLDEVLAIERRSFPSAWSRQSYERELRNGNSYYFVAREEDRVAGYVGMWVIRDEAHVTTLAVRPDCRRRGLGRRLLAQAISIARSNRAGKLTLEVRAGNLPARSLYERFGFEPMSFIPNYYGDTGEDALIMRKLLFSDGDGARGD